MVDTRCTRSRRWSNWWHYSRDNLRSEMCFSIFKKPVVDPNELLPVSNELIQGSEVGDILRAAAPDAHIYLSDRNYILCKYDDVALFVAQDQTNKYEYIAEEYDCDDSAYRLMGQFSIPNWSHLCLGIIWSDFHAFNGFIDDNRKLRFIEPQTDKIYDYLRGDMGNRIHLIVM